MLDANSVLHMPNTGDFFHDILQSASGSPLSDCSAKGYFTFLDTNFDV